jgi:hypothetical protein
LHRLGEEAPVTAGRGDEIPQAGAGGGGLRASHADREQVVELLKAAFVRGRLTRGEFDARLGRALVSRTHAELAALTAGIHPGLAGDQLGRRPAARRRARGWAVAAVAVLLLAGAGAAVFTRAPAPVPAGVPFPAGVPRYYVQQGFTAAPRPVTVVRATATGAVTASVRCPWPDGSIGDVAAAGDQAFFMVCQRAAGHGADADVTGSRIYRFHVTGSGRVAGYSLVPGGALAGLQAGGLAVSADGSTVAVTTIPAAASGSAGPAEIMVINARTGARAVWRNAPAVPGQVTFGVGDLSLTADGRELAFLGTPQCIKGPCRPTGNGEEVRAVSPAARGGNLSSSRLLLRQSALMRLTAGYINDAVISPGGSSVTVVEMITPGGSAHSTVSVAEVSATTGRQLRVRYRVDTGDGFLYRFFSSDPSGRYLLLDVGPASGTANGWIDDGRLVQLTPANGTSIFHEAW